MACAWATRELEVRHCPGHTPGHVIFFSAESRLAWVGDVLFRGSIGRSDFPRGDYDTLIRSITTQLWPLGDDVAFLPDMDRCRRSATSVAATRMSPTPRSRG